MWGDSGDLRLRKLNTGAMSTTFDRPTRLSVRCDQRLPEMLPLVTKARRQPPGAVLEQLVEAEFDRLVAAGRIPRPGDGERLASIVRHPASLGAK